MVICKFEKINKREFIPHLDIVRAFNMAFRRAGLFVNYSEGFNPHALFFFCQPLPLGIMSKAEYFCVDTIECASDVTSKLNMTLPNGLKILKAKNVINNPNFAANCMKADYVVEYEDELPDFDIRKTLLDKNEFMLTKADKNGVSKTKNVRNLIFKLSQNKNLLKMQLGYGGDNLRADAFIRQFSEFYAWHSVVKCIKKIKVYDKNGINFDKRYFDS